ncbi:hypothetical protein [Limobrevibacterium gyesilva]|uniref:Uncharacterized protein n=1 Tax=Limobrevibacterium gyesilva TaxID=2991712 RepID=A0AA42CFQ0_9PROT|nr:hypothetical protein [Limobrevibacterium gyesilva]MCW3477378.1 hypothetical protein [Limobrevibacterium gyesilva]
MQDAVDLRAKLDGLDIRLTRLETQRALDREALDELKGLTRDTLQAVQRLEIAIARDASARSGEKAGSGSVLHWLFSAFGAAVAAVALGINIFRSH